MNVFKPLEDFYIHAGDRIFYYTIAQNGSVLLVNEYKAIRPNPAN